MRQEVSSHEMSRDRASYPGKIWPGEVRSDSRRHSGISTGSGAAVTSPDVARIDIQPERSTGRSPRSSPLSLVSPHSVVFFHNSAPARSFGVLISVVSAIKKRHHHTRSIDKKGSLRHNSDTRFRWFTALGERSCELLRRLRDGSLRDQCAASLPCQQRQARRPWPRSPPWPRWRQGRWRR